MKKQTLINAIVCLTGTLDALNRAGKQKESDDVVAKILELIKQL